MWLAGYHDSSGDHHDEIRPTWGEAREVMVDELDQRIMALLAEPGATGDADELDELGAARAYFSAGVSPEEEAAIDAAALTFVLVPAETVALRAAITAEAGQVLATSGASEIMEHPGTDRVGRP